MACLLADAAARPETILDYDAQDHKHAQAGDAGNAVTGSYRYKQNATRSAMVGCDKLCST